MTFRPPRSTHASPLQYLGDERRRKATPAEAEFERILNDLNGGVLRGKFLREWVCGKRWIVDFFFPEIRLAVEIDGKYHNMPLQTFRDAARELEIEMFLVTVVRFTNAEVFGDREALIAKLRNAWRKAQRTFRRDRPAPKRNSVDPAAAFPARSRLGAFRRKMESKAYSGGWTSLDQGVTRVGDNAKMAHVDEGFGGSREGARAMKKQTLASMKSRNRGK